VIVQPAMELDRVQLVRKAVLLVFVLISIGFLLFGESRWPSASGPHELIEWSGIGLIVVCIAGRTWCSLYIAGHKVRRLVTLGPYSVSRNPLYVFSVIGALGAGAQLGSMTLAAAAAAATAVIFYFVVRMEERALTVRLGVPYERYLSEVSRFLPDWTLWNDAEKVEAHPRLILRTFVDACVFLLSIPVAEGFEYLHEIGALPTLLTLP
jgi:protein-S-isoprenylcysteine O-methyltransferase Ste14